MKIIGITGGIGSGKTKALSFFKSRNIPCYEADIRAKSLMNSNPELVKTIKSFFGDEIYDKSGLNNKMLAKIVFEDRNLLKNLNDSVHPFVRSDFNRFVSKQKSNIVVHESAILFEHGLQKYFDKIILLITPIEIRIQRLIKRDSLSLDEVYKRIDNQMGDKEKISLADYVVKNLDWEDTIMQLDKIYSEVLGLV
ncbi:MAG: dephospho-CoA kinase [Bacteroidota bacterium]|nr:dephospho-CoA kinase [Bacteroidota bacterium]